MASLQQEKEKQKLWTKDFILLTFSNLFLYLNLQMITPSLPAYATDKFASNSMVISLIISSFAFAAIFCRVFIGKALETMNRKLVLIIGLLIFTASTVGYYWAPTVILFILMRLIGGVGFGISSTAYGTMTSDIVPPKRMGEGIGYFGLSTSLPMSLAPVIGLWLLAQYGPFVLITVATLAVAITFPLSIGIRNRRANKKSSADAAVGSIQVPAAPKKKAPLMDKRLLLPCGLNLLLSITYGGLISFITLFGKEVHIANVGWFFLCNAVMVVLVRPFSGKLFDKKGHAAVLPFGGLMVVVALVLLSMSTSLVTLLCSALCYGIGYGTLQPSLQAWSIGSVSPEHRGMANGAFLNSIDLGIAIGSLCLGVVATATSYAMVYRISSLFMVLFLVVYGMYLLGSRRKMAEV